MKLKASNFALIIAVVVALSGSAFASKKNGSSGAKHVAVGTIASIDANEVVINKKVKGKDQPMTYKLESSTQKTGNLAVGSPVTIQYRTDNNQMIATSIRERSDKSAAAKPAKPSKKS